MKQPGTVSAPNRTHPHFLNPPKMVFQKSKVKWECDQRKKTYRKLIGEIEYVTVKNCYLLRCRKVPLQGEAVCLFSARVICQTAFRTHFFHFAREALKDAVQDSPCPSTFLRIKKDQFVSATTSELKTERSLF